MEEKIYKLQKEYKFLALQLLRLSEDMELMYERMEELKKTKKVQGNSPKYFHMKVLPHVNIDAR